MKDYYAVLRVDPHASQEVIKRTYRNLARTYHPDANPDSRTAEEVFKEINEAYGVLGDPKKRERYDLELGLSRRKTAGGTTRPAGASRTSSQSARPAQTRPRNDRTQRPDGSAPDWSPVGDATPIAIFKPHTPMRGMRIMRKRDAILLDGGDTMAAVVVLEFDRLKQLIWRDDAARAWVVAKAAPRPKASANPWASTSRPKTEYTPPPRTTAPPYEDATAREFVARARWKCDEGKYRAALDGLWMAEPSARLGDAEVARGIIEVAQLMRDTVSRKQKEECDELILRAKNALSSVSAEAAARPKASANPRASTSPPWAGYAPPPRAAAPPYEDATAREFVARARGKCDEGKYKAALEQLWMAEPSARLGDAEVARGIIDVAGLMRDKVSRKQKEQCDALILRAKNALSRAAEEAARPTPPRGPVKQESVITAWAVFGIFWLLLIIVRLIAAAAS